MTATMNSMLPIHFPAPKEVRDLLGDLLDKEIGIGPCPPMAPTHQNPATIGVYVDDALQVRLLIAMDIELSAWCGAAIGLVPPLQADQGIANKCLDETLRENVYEVFNIAASIFNVPEAAHLKLHVVHHAGDTLPHDVHARSLTLGRREDLRIDIAGYGAGRLAVILI